MTLRRRLVAVLATLAAVGGTLSTVALTAAPDAAAVVGSQFDPGNIVSDSVFFDSGTMTADQVQLFLVDKGRSCRAAGGLDCLKDFRTATPSRAAEVGLCDGYAASPLESAGQIIHNVARSCRINPRTLLVLMEKESSLVSRSTPSSTAYRSATGFGCPDTAACDATYYGFFNQVYMAARQFHVYANNPTRYGYRAGRVNSILFNPDPACGRSDVFIANQATAGLYTYTPYQPNRAALDNLYGTGDSCSAYGNRNFWRIFSDWFGDPQTGSYLLRTGTDPTVYLISGSNRYAVPDLPALEALAPLGRVGYVSQGYLDGFTPGRTLGRFLRGPDGTVYLLDAGRLLPAPTCQMVVDYGDFCPATVPITSTQVAQLARGPVLTQVAATSSGRTVLLSGGTRREVFDTASLAAAGLPTAVTGLRDSTIDPLPVAAPVIRDDVLAVSRSDASVWLSRAGRLTRVPATVNAQTTWSLPLLPRLLDAASIAAAPQDPAFRGFARSVDGSRSYLLTASSKVLLTDPAQWSASFAIFSDSLLRSIPDAGTATAPGHLLAPGSPTVYRVAGALARPVTTYAALLATNGGSSPAVTTVTADTVAGFAPGAAVLVPGTLALTTDGGLHLVDGADRLVHLPTFATAASLGLSTASTRLSLTTGYTLAPRDLSTVVRCGSELLLGSGGAVRRVTAAPAGALPVTDLGPAACGVLPRSPAAPLTGEVFLRAEGSDTVYRVTATGRQPVSTYARLLTLTGGAAPVVATLSRGLVDPLPLGPPA